MLNYFLKIKKQSASLTLQNLQRPIPRRDEP
jgi:hypothetical protein